MNRRPPNSPLFPNPPLSRPHFRSPARAPPPPPRRDHLRLKIDGPDLPEKRCQRQGDAAGPTAQVEEPASPREPGTPADTLEEVRRIRDPEPDVGVRGPRVGVRPEIEWARRHLGPPVRPHWHLTP